jgi:hypothetical protein
MATVTSYTVSTSAVRIVAPVAWEKRWVIISPRNSADVHIGSTSAVTSSSAALLKDQYLELPIHANEELWAISASGSHAVDVIITEN